MTTIEKELRIPTVTLVAKGFRDDFRAATRTYGIDNQPLAVVPQEFTSSTDEEVLKQVEEVIEEIIKGLTLPVKAVTGLTSRPITTPDPPEDYPIAPPVSNEIIHFKAVDYPAAADAFQQNLIDWGWSDGITLVPPTKEKVEWMLKGTSHDPDEVVTRLDPLKGAATIRKIAVNAVMAGARPEYLPIILGAVEAMMDPQFEIMRCVMSTGPYGPFLWVNGPIAEEVGINCGRACLGSGSQNRANLAIGRAIRLIMMNIGGAYVGIADMDTIGATHKVSMVVAENERESPWSPYHVDKGFKPEESAVTVLSVVGQAEVQDLASNTPEGFLYTIAHSIVGIGNGSGMFYSPYDLDLSPTQYGHEPVLLLPPSAANTFGSQGWTKDDIREYLYRHARVPKGIWAGHSWFKNHPEMLAPKWREAPADTGIPIVFHPKAFQILVVGGPANKMSYCPPGGRNAAVTKPVDKWR
jgi:hypothetical protein